jgi:predicted PurR-regulated permease PerM
MAQPPIPLFARYVVVALALLALALFIAKLSGVLLLVFAGIVFACVIRAAATPLSRYTKLPETWAVGTVSLVFLVAIVVGAWLFGRRMIAETDQLVTAVHAAWEKIQGRVGESSIATYLLENAQAAAGSDGMQKLAKGTFIAFGGIGDAILVLFLAVYLAADPATYRNGFLALLPRAARGPVGAALTDAGTALRRWLMGQLGAMLFVGVVTALGLALVGVPLAIPLGVLSGLLDFVPVVGPFLAAIPGVVIAFAQGPDVALRAILVYVAVQFIEGHLVIPLAQKWTVATPPALSLAAIVAAGVAFGPPGVLFALPLLVVAIVMVRRLYADRLT